MTNKYKDYNGTDLDYDRDSYDPFTETREQRYWEYRVNREKRGINEDDFDGDWDD